jgi:hypothetical protein
MTISNRATVASLKTQYLTEKNLADTPLDKVRVFCLGKELKDELFMYSYDVADDVVMQLMIRK